MFKVHLNILCAAGALVYSFDIAGAGPVTHAFLAFMWLKRCVPNYSAAQERLFVLGTLFPDIRYIANIPRSATHMKEVSLEEVFNEPDAFTAGKKFHSWVDNKRIVFLKPVITKIYATVLADVPKTIVHTYIKFLEDELLFALRPWQTVCNYLKRVVNQEKQFTISLEVLKEWHTLLRTHFMAPPSVIFARLDKKNKPYGALPLDLVKAWAHALPVHVRSSRVIGYIYTLLADFEEEFARYCSRTSDALINKQ